MQLTRLMIGVGAALAFQLAIIGLGFVLERIGATRPPDAGRLTLNIAYLMPFDLMNAVLGPLSSAGVALLVNSLGGGLIELPTSGVGLLLSIACYALAMDAGEYWFHRAQHRVPALWSLHSLHHSDPAVNVSTTYRHFWGDQFLKAISIYAVVGLIFKVNTVVLTAYGFFTLYNAFLHTDVRVGFGRWSAWLNSPQYHRLHHSSLREHHDCNFAQFFPVFDLLCNTYRGPKINEYPPTGLDTGEVPYQLHGMFLWPWRREFRIPMRIR